MFRIFEKSRCGVLLMGVALLLPLAAKAQWRLGVTGGADYNVFKMDKQYMTDFQINGRWGATAGISGQYEINDWLALRADLNWTQKNYRKNRVILSQIDYRYQNNYLQLPIMASFSTGGERLRGFCNLGIYAGYWLTSWREGSDNNIFSGFNMPFSEKLVFNAESDQRFDFGLAGGIGLEYRIASHWAAQAEIRCYYSTVSTVRQYMRVKDYRYNTTISAQLGIYYIF
ncbi:MAG: PorT family protein [Bacteroidaceae bacterium]|nr:PorT family protein [Bacteroidaceae bacterium]